MMAKHAKTLAMLAAAVEVLTEVELRGRGGFGVRARLRARDHLVG